MNIAILVALNDRQVIGMKAFLYSLLHNNRWFDKDLLLLSDGQLSSKNILLLKKIYPNIKIVEAKTHDYLSCKKTTRDWGFNLYYRFDLFDLGKEGYDRIIMFDADMLVLKDIKDLFLQTCDIGACEKYLGIDEIDPGNILASRKKRFNCGLITVSKNLMTPGIKKALIDIAAEKSWSSDQPVLNKYFEKRVSYLPQKFNTPTSLLTEDTLDMVSIVHFHGISKPWDSEEYKSCFDPFVLKHLSPDLAIKLKLMFNSYIK